MGCDYCDKRVGYLEAHLREECEEYAKYCEEEYNSSSSDESESSDDDESASDNPSSSYTCGIQDITGCDVTMACNDEAVVMPNDKSTENLVEACNTKTPDNEAQSPASLPAKTSDGKK